MTKNKKGFTIIEVVLVLAIAGLIFLMVFIALPALQRSQRNTQRQDDMARIMTAFNNYQSSNNGNYPFRIEANKAVIDHNFVKRYIDSNCTNTKITAKSEDSGCTSEFKDPDGRNYYFSYSTNNNLTTDTDVSTTVSEVGDPNVKHVIHVYTTAKCGNSEGKLLKATGVRNFAILYKLEGGGIYCGDNS